MGRGRGLWHSFAFRLGVAFAVVAIAASALTAGLVSAAFGSPFDRYLEQQRSAQVGQITSLVEHAYRGNGRWSSEALSAVVPLLGSGTLRLEDPYGKTVWQWPSRPSPSPTPTGTAGEGTGQGSSGGATPTPSGTSTSGGSGGSDHGSWDHGDGWDNGDGDWTGGGGWSRSSSGAMTRSFLAAGDEIDVVLVSASGSRSSTSALGPAQRIPIEVDGRTVGYAVIRLRKASQQPSAVAFRSDLVKRLLLGGILAALLSLGLGLMFALRATAPVRQVRGAARALTAGDRSVSLQTERSDEFGDVGRALRTMADSVEEEERLRQGFAAQVAHELRTPLTILQSQVEGLRIGVLEPTPEAIVSLHEEVLRISRLVADLQILGSADAAGFSLERATTDLREAVDETVREFAGLFEGSEVRLESRLEPVIAWVDRVRVGQVLSNLLSNALKFTPPGGLVRVELRRDEPWAVLRVSDSGPGIPADELPHVFDRFFRGRGSRSSGSGIGLTVVSELVRAHGGEVEVSSDPGSGATFTVRLPLQPTPARRRIRAGSEPAVSAASS
ncbi:MAG TPA: HAMP domain-containing sensor histidine kinase [Actinomycetota bacterium]